MSPRSIIMRSVCAEMLGPVLVLPRVRGLNGGNPVQTLYPNNFETLWNLYFTQFRSAPPTSNSISLVLDTRGFSNGTSAMWYITTTNDERDDTGGKLGHSKEQLRGIITLWGGQTLVIFVTKIMSIHSE